jgi:hypothetical protein
MSEPVRVFLLHHMQHAPYLSFGTDAVEAAKPLAAKLGCSTEDFGVGGSWPITEPINMGQFWPYFTNSPSEKMLNHGKEKKRSET